MPLPIAKSRGASRRGTVSIAFRLYTYLPAVVLRWKPSLSGGFPFPRSCFYRAPGADGSVLRIDDVKPLSSPPSFLFPHARRRCLGTGSVRDREPDRQPQVLGSVQSPQAREARKTLHSAMDMAMPDSRDQNDPRIMGPHSDLCDRSKTGADPQFDRWLSRRLHEAYDGILKEQLPIDLDRLVQQLAAGSLPAERGNGINGVDHDGVDATSNRVVMRGHSTLRS